MNASKRSDKVAETPKNDADQIKAFRKAARTAGCDDNEERFRDALRTVAKAKPSAPKPDDHHGGKQRANDKR